MARAWQTRLALILGSCVSAVIEVRTRFMAESDTKVYPTGLTEAEAVEINEGLKWGTRIYFGIALGAHALAFILTPWLG